MSSINLCHPTCPFFRCAQRALKITDREKRICLLTSEPCTPASCSFVICTANKLLSNGRCGRAVRRVTRPLSIEADQMPLRVRVKGKLKELEDELL